MISVVFLVITISIIVCGQTNDNNTKTTRLEPVAVFDVQSYRDKICHNEPTCNLISNSTPNELTTLEYRNCMCDADCAKYGDCCLDSKYYNETEQKRNFQHFHCFYHESVYMIASCPKSYKDTAIKNKCEQSTLPLDSDDIALIIPVTNVNARITYGNKYCAECHGERNYRFWNETRYCSVKQTESIPSNGSQVSQNYPLTNLDNDTSLSSRLQYYNDLFAESVEATKYAKFNSTSKTFYSFYNNKNYDCSFGRAIPQDLETSASRTCKTFISECADVSNKTLVEKCRSYTSIVFYDLDKNRAYRNKECAVCNGVTDKLTGCFSEGLVISAAQLFSTSDKVQFSGHNPCEDPALKNKFCK